MASQVRMDLKGVGQPVTCLGQTFANEDERREHFRGLLREKLADPAFRAAPGFPEGSDDAIVNMSDPPYYTACPNPWIADLVIGMGRVYSSDEVYSRRPSSVDVSEGKSHPIYNAHTYHTKVPHRAILRLIMHYTKPGDVVLDAFCGTGMVGVAAALCGSETELRDCGFALRSGKAYDEENNEYDLGARTSVLADLSPIATFISSNINDLPGPDELDEAARGILRDLSAIEEDLYTAYNDKGVSKGRINYTVWSDVYSCENCGTEYDYWSEAVVLGSGEAKKRFNCPSCSSEQSTRDLTRAYSVYLDPVIQSRVKVMKQVPVLMSYFGTGGTRQRSELSDRDRALAAHIPDYLDLGAPAAVELPKGDRFGRDAFADKGITHVHQFYTWRNLRAVTSLVRAIENSEYSYSIKRALMFVVTSFADRNGTRRNRFVINSHNPSGRVNGPMANTLYLPNLSCEMNIFSLFREKLKDIINAIYRRPKDAKTIISTGSAEYTRLPENSIDYIFTDPPFGHNIQYSELNLSLESLLGVKSSSKSDIVVNEQVGKTIDFYHDSILNVFREYFRVLKPGRWITIEFSNTQAAIWNSIQSALSQSGFVIASVTTFDKSRGGMHSLFGATAVKQDLAITAYKPNGGLEDRFEAAGLTDDTAWDFIRTHLKNLAVVKRNRSHGLEMIAERDPRRLFDRMIAWFVRHNTPVPLSSAEFQAGLAERFPERDGMFFLPNQIDEYDKARMQAGDPPQRDLFVDDERTAIDWITDFLKAKPSTYQEVHPDFTQKTGAGWRKHETKPELLRLLDENFLKFDGNGPVPSQIHAYLSSNWKEMRNLDKDDPQLVDKARNRWFVPDPNKQHDVEARREKALLREFDIYKAHKGKKMKEIRLEVMRVGFKAAWAAKDYRTILDVSAKVPDEVWQEDERLMMLHSMAETRLEAER